jgi:hypothetical protein
MDWGNPEERADLLSRGGIKAYNNALAKHVEESTIVTIGGHAIRKIETQFGTLFQCGDTGKAFKELSDAEDYAAKNKKEEMQ